MGLVGTDLYKKGIVHRTSPNTPALTLPGGSLYDLQGHVVWVFHPNKVDFLGPFVNYTAAARELNPSLFVNTTRMPSNISVPLKRIANREAIISTEKGQYYLAYNPTIPPYPSNPLSKSSPLFNKSLPLHPFQREIELIPPLTSLFYSHGNSH